MTSRHKDAGAAAAKAAAAPAADALTDPLRAWREWFVRNEREWSESLTKVMKEEAVARAVGQQINAALHAQQMMSQGMARPLEMLNLPAREDVVALGERIGRLEDAVARLEAAVVQMRSAGSAGAKGADAKGAGAAEPARRTPRTRKPPRGAGR